MITIRNQPSAGRQAHTQTPSPTAITHFYMALAATPGSGQRPSANRHRDYHSFPGMRPTVTLKGLRDLPPSGRPVKIAVSDTSARTLSRMMRADVSLSAIKEPKGDTWSPLGSIGDAKSSPSASDRAAIQRNLTTFSDHGPKGRHLGTPRPHM